MYQTRLQLKQCVQCVCSVQVPALPEALQGSQAGGRLSPSGQVTGGRRGCSAEEKS